MHSLTNQPKTETLHEHYLTRKNGLYFNKQNNKPFTGIAIETHIKDNIFDLSAIKTEIAYKNGEKDGFAASFYQDGQLYEEGHYKNGARDGDWVINQRVYLAHCGHNMCLIFETVEGIDKKDFFEDDYSSFQDQVQNIRLKQTFKKGKRHGLFESLTNHREHDEQYWYEHLERISENYKHGKKHGPRQWFYENGALKSKCLYKNGVRHGEMHAYYNNKISCDDFPDEINLSRSSGTVSTENNRKSQRLLQQGNYKNGKEDGLWQTFSEKGSLLAEGHYKDGARDGLWQTFYQEGQLYKQGYYKNGKEDGLWEGYFEDHRVKERKFYKSGINLRISDTFDYTGRLEYQDTFDYKTTGNLLRTHFEHYNGCSWGRVWDKKHNLLIRWECDEKDQIILIEAPDGCQWRPGITGHLTDARASMLDRFSLLPEYLAQNLYRYTYATGKDLTAYIAEDHEDLPF